VDNTEMARIPLKERLYDCVNYNLFSFLLILGMMVWKIRKQEMNV
jgi:hypothetical protein